MLIAGLETQVKELNLQLSSLRIDKCMGIVGEKKTYVDTYKELHDKYVAVKVRRFQEHWSRSIELFRAKEEVITETVILCILK